MRCYRKCSRRDSHIQVQKLVSRGADCSPPLPPGNWWRLILWYGRRPCFIASDTVTKPCECQTGIRITKSEEYGPAAVERLLIRKIVNSRASEQKSNVGENTLAMFRRLDASLCLSWSRDKRHGITTWHYLKCLTDPARSCSAQKAVHGTMARLSPVLSRSRGLEKQTQVE